MFLFGSYLSQIFPHFLFIRSEGNLFGQSRMLKGLGLLEPALYAYVMRWAWVVIKSLASGLAALVATFIVLIMVLNVYALLLLKGSEGPERGEVGWDFISMIMRWGLSPHAAEAVLLGFWILIFAIGFAMGFSHFSRPLR